MASVEARFWAKVDKRGPVVRRVLGHCWVWTAALYRGYGVFAPIGTKTVLAHRLSWRFAFGAPKACVLHKCDNRRCVRPSHLFEGTRLDNNLDKKAKQRQCRGETRPLSKLTDASVEQMRSDWASGDYTQRELGERYGVCQPIVSRTVRGQRWRHI